MALNDILNKNKVHNDSKSKVNADALNAQVERDLVNNNQNAISGHQPAKVHEERQPEIPHNKIAEEIRARAETREHLQQAKEQEDYIYSCPNAHQFKIGLSDGPVQAKHGVMIVTPAQHKEIQELIHKHKRFDIAQNAILLDQTAAEEIAKKHMTEEQRRSAAARGMTSTMQTQAHMQNIEGHQIENKLDTLNVVELDAVHAEDSQLNPDKHQ